MAEEESLLKGEFLGKAPVSHQKRVRREEDPRLKGFPQITGHNTITSKIGSVFRPSCQVTRIKGEMGGLKRVV